MLEWVKILEAIGMYLMCFACENNINLGGGWNLCVSPKFMCWNPNLNVIVLRGKAFRRWLDHEDGTPMDGIIAPIKETPESSLTPAM